MCTRVDVEQAQVSPISVLLQFLQREQSPSTPVLRKAFGQARHRLSDSPFSCSSPQLWASTCQTQASCWCWPGLNAPACAHLSPMVLDAQVQAVLLQGLLPGARGRSHGLHRLLLHLHWIEPSGSCRLSIPCSRKAPELGCKN